MSRVVVAGSDNSISFAIIDFTDPANPTESMVNPGFGAGCRVVLKVDRCFAGSALTGLVREIDVTDPANPVPRGTINTQLAGIGSLAVQGNLVAVGEWVNSYKARVVLLDFTNPDSPVQTAIAATPLSSAPGDPTNPNPPAISAVVFTGPRLVVVAGPANPEIVKIDFTNAAAPVVTSFLSGFNGVTMDADTSYICAGDSTGFQVELLDANSGTRVAGPTGTTIGGISSLGLAFPIALLGSTNAFQAARVTFTGSSGSVTLFTPSPSGGFTTGIDETLGVCGEINGSAVTLVDLSPATPSVLGNKNSSLPSIGTIAIQSFAPTATWTPANLDFGAVAVGTTDTKTLTIANSGTIVLTVTGIASSSPHFTVTPATTSVPPGQSTTIQVSFQPSAATSYSATLRFQTNDPGHATVTVPMTGTGGYPAATWAPSSLAFGTVEVGATGQGALSITNAGIVPLNISGISSSSSQFAASTQALTIQPGQTATVQATFKPSAPTSYSATLSFQTNDPGHPSVTVPMTGNGVLPTVSWTPASIDFDTIPQGSSATQDLFITNNGTADVHVTNAHVTYSRSGQQDGFSVSPTSLAIPPGQSGSLAVTFTPLGSWPFGYDASGDLIFQTDDLAHPSGDVPVSGTQQPWGCLTAPAALVARAYKAATRRRVPRRR
jgi:Abnormal spindle-like microcephaly-assoc'd, ASPM-SPD-2-Hydin/Bacterial Ig-like domain (group 2)